MCICALFGDFSFRGEDNDPVCATDGGETVGDGEGCGVGAHDFLEGVVDEEFRVCVEGTGGFY